MNTPGLSAYGGSRLLATICPSCGVTFGARSVLTVYCSNTCKARAAYYRRKGEPIPAVKIKRRMPRPIRPQQLQLPAAVPATIEERKWNGTAIQRRADGFVNATAMCQAEGKRWHEYSSNQRTQDYVAALTADLRSAGNPADPVDATTTGPNHLRGTWIHPRLAVDLARWISPAFAVWMDGWFLESVTRPAVSQPVLPVLPKNGVVVYAKDKFHARVVFGDVVWRSLLSGIKHEPPYQFQRAA